MAEKIDDYVLMIGIVLAFLAVGIGLMIYWQKQLFKAYRDDVLFWLRAHNAVDKYVPHRVKELWLGEVKPRDAARRLRIENLRSVD